MKKIPLEQRLRAAVTGETFCLKAFAMPLKRYLYSLSNMSRDYYFTEFYKEIELHFPKLADTLLAEVVYESEPLSEEQRGTLLYNLLVEAFRYMPDNLWEDEF